MLIYFFMLHPSCLVENITALLSPKCKDFWSETYCVHNRSIRRRQRSKLCVTYAVEMDFYGEFVGFVAAFPVQGRILNDVFTHYFLLGHLRTFVHAAPFTIHV